MTDTKDIPLQQLPFKIEDLPIAVSPDHAPLIFCDGFQGLAVYNDSVRINAFQLSQNLDATDAPPNKVFVARMAMSPMTAIQLMKWLQENLQFAGVSEGEVPTIGEAK